MPPFHQNINFVIRDVCSSCVGLSNLLHLTGSLLWGSEGASCTSAFTSGNLRGPITQASWGRAGFQESVQLLKTPCSVLSLSWLFQEPGEEIKEMVLPLSVDEKHILWLPAGFASPSPSTSRPWPRWPHPREPCGCVPESISTRGRCRARSWKKRERGVYRPKDAFQLLLLTPFQSKLSGLFQVPSGQSAVGFAVSCRSRGENSIALAREEEGIQTPAVGQFGLGEPGA